MDSIQVWKLGYQTERFNWWKEYQKTSPHLYYHKQKNNLTILNTLATFVKPQQLEGQLHFTLGHQNDTQKQ